MQLKKFLYLSLGVILCSFLLHTPCESACIRNLERPRGYERFGHLEVRSTSLNGRVAVGYLRDHEKYILCLWTPNKLHSIEVNGKILEVCISSSGNSIVALIEDKQSCSIQRWHMEDFSPENQKPYAVIPLKTKLCRFISMECSRDCNGVVVLGKNIDGENVYTSIYQNDFVRLSLTPGQSLGYVIPFYNQENYFLGVVYKQTLNGYERVFYMWDSGGKQHLLRTSINDPSITHVSQKRFDQIRACKMESDGSNTFWFLLTKDNHSIALCQLQNNQLTEIETPQKDDMAPISYSKIYPYDSNVCLLRHTSKETAKTYHKLYVGKTWIDLGDNYYSEIPPNLICSPDKNYPYGYLLCKQAAFETPQLYLTLISPSGDIREIEVKSIFRNDLDNISNYPPVSSPRESKSYIHVKISPRKTQVLLLLYDRIEDNLRDRQQSKNISLSNPVDNSLKPTNRSNRDHFQQPKDKSTLTLDDSPTMISESGDSLKRKWDKPSSTESGKGKERNSDYIRQQKRNKAPSPTESSMHEVIEIEDASTTDASKAPSSPFYLDLNIVPKRQRRSRNSLNSSLSNLTEADRYKHTSPGKRSREESEEPQASSSSPTKKRRNEIPTSNAQEISTQRALLPSRKHNEDNSLTFEREEEDEGYPYSWEQTTSKDGEETETDSEEEEVLTLEKPTYREKQAHTMRSSTSLRRGCKGFMPGSTRVFTTASYGQIRNIRFKRETIRAQKSFVNDEFDLQVVILDKPFEIREPRLEWMNEKCILDPHDSSRNNLPLKVVVVSCERPKFNKYIKENGTNPCETLYFDPQDARHYNGTVRRTDVQNEMFLIFTPSRGEETSQLINNGDTVYIKTDAGEYHLLGIFSARAMEEGKGHILNLCHPKVKEWIDSLSMQSPAVRKPIIKGTATKTHRPSYLTKDPQEEPEDFFPIEEEEGESSAGSSSGVRSSASSSRTTQNNNEEEKVSPSSEIYTDTDNPSSENEEEEVINPSTLSRAGCKGAILGNSHAITTLSYGRINSVQIKGHTVSAKRTNEHRKYDLQVLKLSPSVRINEHNLLLTRIRDKALV